MKKSAQHNKSEVARLLSQIQEEYEAAMLAMRGFASGSATHPVISQKTIRIYLLEDQLEALVGSNATVALIDQQLKSSSIMNNLYA